MFEREFANAKAILAGLGNQSPPAGVSAEVKSARATLAAQLVAAESALKQELKISKTALAAIDAVLAADAADATAVKAATHRLVDRLGVISAADDTAVARLSAARMNLKVLLTLPAYRGDAGFRSHLAEITRVDQELRQRRMDQLLQQLEALAPAINTAAKALKKTVDEWTQVIDGIKKAAQALGVVIQALAFL